MLSYRDAKLIKTYHILKSWINHYETAIFVSQNRLKSISNEHWGSFPNILKWLLYTFFFLFKLPILLFSFSVDDFVFHKKTDITSGNFLIYPPLKQQNYPHLYIFSPFCWKEVSCSLIDSLFSLSLTSSFCLLKNQKNWAMICLSALLLKNVFISLSTSFEVYHICFCSFSGLELYIHIYIYKPFLKTHLLDIRGEKLWEEIGSLHPNVSFPFTLSSSTYNPAFVPSIP